MEVAHFINMFLSKGGKALTPSPEHGVGWDWYGTVREMTSEIDFGCQFEKYAPGCKNHRRTSGLCCCGGCSSSVGFLSILPSDHTILTGIANKFILPDWAKKNERRPCDTDVIKPVGFWKQGEGCQLPRRYRSRTCLNHSCDHDAKMPKRHKYLLSSMLNQSDLVRHRNGFLELYPSYSGRLPMVGRLSTKFKNAFWHYVDTMLERPNADVNTPAHKKARKTTLSEIERTIRDGRWKKLKKITELFGPYGPVDDPYTLQGIANALIDRCERENWKGDISTERAAALASMLVVNGRTGTVHIGAEGNDHGTLCNTWTWGDDMHVTSSMNITCKRCLNLLKTREVL